MRPDTGVSKLELSVEGMHCSSCGIWIDEAVEEIDGVISSRTKVRRGRTVVELDPGKVEVGAVLQAINSLGYRARLNQR
jgi:copper chaperone